MGMGSSSNSGRHKNSSRERKKRKKATRAAKSGKRRRHDCPSSSSSSGYFSSESEGGGGRGSRGCNTRKDDLVRQQPSLDGGLWRRQKKKKRKNKKKMMVKKRKISGEGERELKRRDARSKLSGEGNPQKKGRDSRRCRSRSRSTSVGSLDGYSSRSCSTCRSHSSSPKRTKSDRSLKSKGKVLKVSSSARGRSSSRRGKERSGRRFSRGGYRNRSPSCSSCSRSSHTDRSRSQVRGRGSEGYLDEGGLAEKSCSRHSLSAAAVMEHSEEMEGRYHGGQDENWAGIVQGLNDFHTSRSNDRYDGGSRRDSGMAPLPPSQQRRRHIKDFGGNGHADKAEDDLNREISSSVIATAADDEVQWGNRNDSPITRDTQPRLKSQVSTSGGCSDADELELLLRQKALENFKKIRARISTNANSVLEHKYESIPIKAHEVTTGKSEAVQFHERGRPVTVPTKQTSNTSLDCHTPPNDGSQLLQFEAMSDANAPTPACNLIEETERNNWKLVQRHQGDTVNTEIVPGRVLSNSNPCSKEFQAESSGKVFGNILSSKHMLGKKNPAKPGDTDIHMNDSNRVDVSASTDTSCYKSSSEFEQKTMSVMHGGEAVQVSYKVYIPKRTPALARRWVQR